jgi:hypothetical protein
VRTADQREWTTGGFPEGELRGSGDLVGNGSDCRSHHSPVGIGLAACALATILFGLALFYGAALLGLA